MTGAAFKFTKVVVFIQVAFHVIEARKPKKAATSAPGGWLWGQKHRHGEHSAQERAF